MPGLYVISAPLPHLPISNYRYTKNTITRKKSLCLSSYLHVIYAELVLLTKMILIATYCDAITLQTLKNLLNTVLLTQAATPPSAEASPRTGTTTPASQSSNMSSNPEFSSSSLLTDNVASHPSASQDVLK
jgi:hypothetical protein